MIACARAYVFNKCSLDRHSPTCKGIISPALLGFSVLEAMASAYFTPSCYGQPLAAVITFYVGLFIFNIPIIPMEVPRDFGVKFLTSQTVHRRTVWIHYSKRRQVSVIYLTCIILCSYWMIHTRTSFFSDGPGLLDRFETQESHQFLRTYNKNLYYFARRNSV